MHSSCTTWAVQLSNLPLRLFQTACSVRTARNSNLLDRWLTSTDVAQKGIAGRAVFADWYTWALKQGKQIDATSSYAVPFSEILEALESQGFDRKGFRKGDILIIRFGYLRQYADMDENKRQQLDEHYKTHKPDNIGVEPSEEFPKFLWDLQLAAVAGDTRSFEVWPCTKLEFHLHEWLLAGWGMPIGELFDLEELSEICASTARSTFFLASAPMNVSPLLLSPKWRYDANDAWIGTWSGSESAERVGILLVAQFRTNSPASLIYHFCSCAWDHLRQLNRNNIGQTACRGR